MLRSCTSNLLSVICNSSKGLGGPVGATINERISHAASIRTFFTSPVLQMKTRKRRKRYPFFWLQDKYRAFYDEKLTDENEKFFQQFLAQKYSLKDGKSPLRQEPWNTNEQYDSETTQRVGVIARKLGTYPQWDNNGKRLLTTCLQVSDNHLIKYHSPEKYQEIGRPVSRKRFAGLGCAIVGSDSRDPRQFTSEYNGLFNEAGVMPKKKLTRFFISHNARIEPGTPLLATHFRPGMFVDVFGRSTDQGLVSLRRRYKLKLGRKTHGTTKAHNRIGSIGRGRKWAGPLKGRRMPGHMGHERKIVPGLKVWRINTKYNLIYVQGPGIPGLNGAYVNLMDSRMPKKTLKELNITPPFPTATIEETSQLDEELFDQHLHPPSAPSLVFEISEEERKAAALALRRQTRGKTAEKR